MDKFGIFKLLNSFYNFYEKNKQSAPSEKAAGSNASDNSSANSSGNFLSNLNFPFFGGQNTQKKEENNKGTINTVNAVNKVPLQRSMLSTMSSHDDFVKRVMKNNSPDKVKK